VKKTPSVSCPIKYLVLQSLRNPWPLVLVSYHCDHDCLYQLLQRQQFNLNKMSPAHVSVQIRPGLFKRWITLLAIQPSNNRDQIKETIHATGLDNFLRFLRLDVQLLAFLKVIAAKLKNVEFPLLAPTCVFLLCKNFSHHFLGVRYFWAVLYISISNKRK